MAMEFLSLDASTILFFRDVVEELKTLDNKYYHSVVFKKRCQKQRERDYYIHKTWGFVLDDESDFNSAFGKRSIYVSKSIIKCGIEILGMKPNRTGDKCHRGDKMFYNDLTIEELKEHCAMNNIKKGTSKMNKTMLIYALMKL